MRKLMIILCVAAIACLGLANIASAGIVNTSHEYDTQPGGTCARCHLPHGAASGSDRLWIATPGVTGITNVGEVSILCSYCHATGGGGDATASATSWIWGTASHGVMMSTANLPFSQVDYTGAALDLPYYAGAADANIECTTCHDVHNDTTGGTGFRPFLRADLDDICSMCHGLRRFEDQNAWTGTTGSTGVWSTDDSHYGDGNRMTHPIGTDVGDDAYDPLDSPITLALPFNAARTSTLDDWAMGGHLTATGSGVTCVTCHAVHGVQADTGEGGLTDSIPYPNMLVLSQGGGSSDGNRTIANGNASWNRLCEACHDGTANATYNFSTTNPDPGGSGFGHPVDDMERAGLQNWVDAADFPATWPSGDPTLKNGALTADPIVVCGSCHVTHPNANLTRNDDTASAGGFTTSQYILRTSRTDICAECHVDINAVNHHPVGVTFDQVGTAAGYLDNVDSATAGQTLSCVTCHTGEGAHNWSSSGAAGLDSNWLPSDNGRGDATIAQDQYDVALGRTCMDCHYNLTAANGISPTKNDGTAEGTPAYNTLGSATHFIGALGVRYGFTAMAAYWASTGATNGNIATYDWGAGAWSRFGNTAAAPALVCESCHELEPDKNQGTAHLLLDTYVEGDTADTGSEFCEGCHLPIGTHPTTNDIVTRAEPNRTLETGFATIDWLFNPSVLDSNPTMGADAMNCDSCHQPHDAATNSATFILDVDNAKLGPASGTNYSEAGSYTNALGYVTAYQTGKGGNHQSFCNVCHTYE